MFPSPHPIPSPTLVITDYGSSLGILAPETGEIDERFDCADAPVSADTGESDIDISRWPRLSLSAVELADCSTTVAPREFSSSYTDLGSTLDAADRKDITADLRRAFLHLVTQAHAQGACCSTTVMRYRFIGHDGDTLFNSAPILVGLSAPGALTAPIAMTSTDRQHINPYDVTAREWRLRVRCAAVSADMASAVSRIEILAAPRLLPIDPMEDAYIKLVREVTSSVMLRVVRSRASRFFAPGNADVDEARMSRILEVLPSLERVVGVIKGPFTPGDSIDIQPTLHLSAVSLSDEATVAERPAKPWHIIVEQPVKPRHIIAEQRSLTDNNLHSPIRPPPILTQSDPNVRTCLKDIG